MRCGNFSPLALRKELLDVHKNGAIMYSQLFSVKFKLGKQNKMAFIVRKKLGKAHERNLVKRRFREIIKLIDTRITPRDENNEANNGVYCIIIAKQEAFGYPFTKLDHETNKVFTKIFNQLNAKASESL